MGFIITLLACVWLFFTVCLQMSPKTDHERGCKVTPVALVWYLPSFWNSLCHYIFWSANNNCMFWSANNDCIFWSANKKYVGEEKGPAASPLHYWCLQGTGSFKFKSNILFEFEDKNESETQFLHLRMTVPILLFKNCFPWKLKYAPEMRFGNTRITIYKRNFVWQFGKIYLKVWTNKFCNLDKCI